MNRTDIDSLTRELARHGVDRWHIDRKHRHLRLQFELDGREVFYVIPSTSSDWRGALNARADLRRMLRGG